MKEKDQEKIVVSEQMTMPKTEDKQEIAAGSEGSSTAAAVVEDTPAYIPGKKKKKLRWIIIGVIVLLLIVFFISRESKKKNALPMVDVIEVQKSDIEETVTISGSVASAELKAYYAPVGAVIGTLPVSVGDRIKAGDLLFAYDEGDLETLKRQAELNIDQATGNYKGSLEKNAKSTNVLRGLSIGEINDRIYEITTQVDDLNFKINEKTARMNQTLTDLQKTLKDVDQNDVADSLQEDKNWAERKDEDGKQIYLQLQKSVDDYQYAISNDPEIQEWKNTITLLNDEKSILQEQKSAETSRLTGSEKAALAAQLELTELNNNVTLEDIEEALNGIHADFEGVVTEIPIKEGATVQKGAQILTVQSTENVEIAFQITKNDLSKIKVGQAVDITVNGNTYDGEVSYISGIATKNSGGVAVVDAKIKIKNPDDKLILGVEASNKIHTNHADDVIVVPYEYVGADSEGDFVFVVEEGVAKRRSVKIGLTTTTDAEIIEGLSAGEFMIAGDTETMVDGTRVDISPESGF